MIQVIINGTPIDLISKGVTYTRQVNDLSDISTVNASFTYALKVPKTPTNTQLFNRLGMVGDTSKTPYVKNTAQLIDNGAVLIQKGIAIIQETSSEYKLHISDGIIDVFKLLENKSLGNDLDLSELEHNKTAESIIESWGLQDPNIEESLTGFPYRYLIADYNGKTNNLTGIDSQYQIPSVNVKYLWDKVFNYIGYTYSGDFTFIDNKWITYPKPPELEEGESTTVFNGITTNYNGAFNDSYKKWILTGPDPLTDVLVINHWQIRINQTARYKINFYGVGQMTYKVDVGFATATLDLGFRINLYVNGEYKTSVISNESFETDPRVSGSFDIVLQADNTVEFTISPLQAEDLTSTPNYIKVGFESGNYSVTNLKIDSLNVELFSTARENIDFRTVLSDFSITDFFKEVMFRGALTPFVDNIRRHIDFVSLKERLNTDRHNVIDFSDKYARRESETYTLGDYAQTNLLTLKYNTAEENYYNGNLQLDNKNVQDKKILFASKFYAPEREQAEVNYTSTTTGKVPLVKLWEKEAKEDAEGNTEINYKPLNNRFYFLSGKKETGKSITINGIEATGFYSASISGTTMPEVITSKYKDIDRIFKDTRVHEIDLLITAYDFQSLDLKKLYYFIQEGQFYILNRLIWQSGKISKGEFLRVKKK